MTAEIEISDKSAEARFRDGTLAYKVLLDELASAPIQTATKAPESQPASYQAPPEAPITGHPRGIKVSIKITDKVSP